MRLLKSVPDGCLFGFFKKIQRKNVTCVEVFVISEPIKVSHF